MDLRQRNTLPKIQYRFGEVRADSDGAGFSGHAAHFGSVDSYGTAIKKGAFRKTLKERAGRIPVLYQHNPDWPIGKPTELKEDGEGLAFSADIVEATQYGAEAMTLLRNEVPLGMSFGFETIKSRPLEAGDDLDFSDAPDFYKQKEGREYVRVIEEVRLWEISLVTFPANQQATITGVRSELELDALTSLLEHMREGTLDERQTALVAELVAASQAQPEPKPDPDTGTTPLTAADARRRTHNAQIAVALAKTRGWLGVQV